jgi:hypothetical protein
MTDVHDESERISKKVTVAQWRRYPRIFLEGLKKIVKNSIRIAEIRTQNLPSTSIELYL